MKHGIMLDFGEISVEVADGAVKISYDGDAGENSATLQRCDVDHLIAALTSSRSRVEGMNMADRDPRWDKDTFAGLALDDEPPVQLPPFSTMRLPVLQTFALLLTEAMPHVHACHELAPCEATNFTGDLLYRMMSGARDELQRRNRRGATS